MIHEMSDMVVLHISDQTKLLQMKRWMDENGLELGEDWAFYGFFGEPNVHAAIKWSGFALAIKDKDKAMLFKLTWC